VDRGLRHREVQRVGYQSARDHEVGTVFVGQRRRLRLLSRQLARITRLVWSGSERQCKLPRPCDAARYTGGVTRGGMAVSLAVGVVTMGACGTTSAPVQVAYPGRQSRIDPLPEAG
jgi:hypothetical protein